MKVFENFFKEPNKSIESEAIKVDEPTNLVNETRNESKPVQGKIIKLSEQGWGFISSKEIKFTRIFFHWTSLKNDTLKFQQLKIGTKVSFIPIEVQGKGFRAIRIEVLS